MMVLTTWIRVYHLHDRRDERSGQRKEIIAYKVLRISDRVKDVRECREPRLGIYSRLSSTVISKQRGKHASRCDSCIPARANILKSVASERVLCGVQVPS